MRFGFVVVALVLVSVIGCANPRATVITNDPAKWETELKSPMEKLSESERELVAGYLVRAKLGEAFGGIGVPPGTTIDDAIKNQQAWKVEQEAKKAEEERKKAEEERIKAAKQVEEERLKQELAQRKAEAQKRFDDALTVALVTKGFRPADSARFEFRSYHTYTFGFQNKTTKEMIGVKGAAKLADLFGDEIKSINLSYDKPIAPGTSVSWDAQSDFNQFGEKDAKLRDTPQDRIKFSFVPEVILFADGSKLEAPADKP